MRVILLSILGIAFIASINIGYADSQVQQCKDLVCVRKNINQIDSQIVNLLGQRLQYVKRAGELKKKVKSVHDQARENVILSTVGKQAQQQGYPATIAQNVFSTILQQANIYEKKYHHYNSTQTDSLAKVQKSGVLSVCTTGDYPPITEYINGNFRGEAIKKAKELAKYLGVKIKFVKTSWPTLSADVSAGKCDIAMGGISYTSARAKDFLLTKPIIHFGKVPLVRCQDVKNIKL